MQPVQLITDSGCDVLGGGFDGTDVRVIPLPYSLDESERIDDPQYAPALDTFYDAIRRGVRATTSQARVADCAHVFKTCADLSTPAVYITLPSGLSGTFEAASHARELVLAERPGAEIYVVGSLCVATGQALLVSEAARHLADGCSVQEAASWAEDNKLRVQHLLTVDSLEHLVRGGRIAPAGQYKPQAFVGHARCESDASSLQGFLAEVAPECRITPTRIGLVIGAHTGPSAVMAAYWGHHRMN